MSSAAGGKRKARTALSQLESHLKGPKDELQSMLYPTEGRVDYEKLKCVGACVRGGHCVWGVCSCPFLPFLESRGLTQSAKPPSSSPDHTPIGSC